jgi:acetyl-CoA decarbonylase/synthase complex subunit delta
MPATVEIPKERWTAAIRQVTLGATAAEGGTRTRKVTVGGQTTLPYLFFEGSIPNPPVIAIEIQDSAPTDWSPVLLQAWGDVVNDPAAWAKKAEELGAEVIVLKLRGGTAAEAAAAIKAVLKATGLPIVVRGPGQADLDNELLVAVAEAGSGERLALGLCEDKNYRTIVAGALAHGHLVLASSPIDVNLAKQLNILISDMRLPLDRVLMDPTTGALGYGLEYTYSVMERLRLAALTGDGMTQQPMICFVGEESWRQKESRAAQGVPAEWGDIEKRAIAWEIVTATALLEVGADIIVLRHPKTVETIRGTINKLMAH